MTENNSTSESLVLVADRIENGILSINSTVNGIGDVVVRLKEIKADMHAMDIQLNAYLATLDNDLKKYQTSAPIVKERLDNMDARMNRMLDKVLTMDGNTSEVLENKIILLDFLNQQTDKLASMMIKLL